MSGLTNTPQLPELLCIERARGCRARAVGQFVLCHECSPSRGIKSQADAANPQRKLTGVTGVGSGTAFASPTTLDDGTGHASRGGRIWWPRQELSSKDAVAGNSMFAGSAQSGLNCKNQFLPHSDGRITAHCRDHVPTGGRICDFAVGNVCGHILSC